jgi:hypothetical protein
MKLRLQRNFQENFCTCFLSCGTLTLGEVMEQRARWISVSGKFQAFFFIFAE